MKSRLIINLLLLLLAIGLGLVVWLKPGQQPNQRLQLTTLDPRSIQLIRIDRQSGNSIELTRQNGQWWLTQPIKAAALNGKVERLLKISQISPPVSYPLDANALSRFGLLNPVVRLRFNDTHLAIGSTESMNARRYVSDDTQLYLVDDTFLHHLTAPIDDYLDTRLLADGVQITQLHTPKLQLQQTKNGHWQNLLQPNEELSADAVQMLFDEWRFARAIHVSHQPSSATIGDAVLITFSSGETKRFNVIRQQNEVILVANDTALAYTLSLDKYQKMSQLTKPTEPDA